MTLDQKRELARKVAERLAPLMTGIREADEPVLENEVYDLLCTNSQPTEGR